jgi:hypothetical protein
MNSRNNERKPANHPGAAQTVFVSGLPQGAVLSAGYFVGNVIWSLSADQLQGLTITAPADFLGTLAANVALVAAKDDDRSYLPPPGVQSQAKAPVEQIKPRKGHVVRKVHFRPHRHRHARNYDNGYYRNGYLVIQSNVSVLRVCIARFEIVFPPLLPASLRREWLRICT